MPARIAAHRGGAALWPENSLLAFRNALALRVDLLELDVHLSADGEVVVFHDRTLERLTGADGAVGARSVAELRALRLKNAGGVVTDERIPTLDEVLDLVAPSAAALLLEIKGPGVSVVYERDGQEVRAITGPRYEGLEEKAIAWLDARRMSARTSIMAFNPDVLACVHELAPGQRTTLLLSRDAVAVAEARAIDTIEWAVRSRASDVGMQYTLVDDEVVRDAHRRGLTIGAWTVNDAREMQRLARLGVDTITTDDPALACRTLGTGS